MTGKINNETLTKAICNKGFRGNSSILPRIKFRVGGQKSSPQSLTAYSLDRYALFFQFMKMTERLNKIIIRKTPLTLIGVIVLLTFLISSCRTTNNVATSNLIQKRKYNSGYFVNVFSKSPSTTKSKIKDKNTAIKTEKEQEIQTNNSIDLIASTDNIFVSNQKPLACQLNKLISSNNNKIQQSVAVQKREMTCFPKSNVFNHLPADTSDGKPKVNWKSLTGFFCGMFGIPVYLIISESTGGGFWDLGLKSIVILFIIIPVFLIILCAQALRQIKKEPTKWNGRGFAKVGLYFGIFLLSLFLLGFLILIGEILFGL